MSAERHHAPRLRRAAPPGPSAAAARRLFLLLALTSWAWHAAPRLLAQQAGPAGGGQSDGQTVAEAAAAAAQRREPTGPVLRLRLDSPIHPVAANFVAKGLAQAAERDARALLVELSTPGGSLPATRRLCQDLLGAEVPVIVYVSPAGAQAASAGFFLLMAADIAAMAPGTNTGSAHPVGGSGEDIEGDMGAKVEQDALALIRALSEEHGRDLEAAQAAVEESLSYTASEALTAGLVDHVAVDVTALLEAVDGAVVERGGQAWRLATRGAPVEELEMSAEQRLIAALAHPQIAGLLMAFGLLGLYAEISNPGLILPGVVGSICLILGFFALSVLPVDYAGLALMALALVLFVAETQVPSFGILTLGGAVALGLGLTMLADGMDPALRPNLWWPVATAGLVAAAAGAASWQTMRSRRRRPVTGRDGMLGEHGTARTALDPSGTVRVHGETWKAETERTETEKTGTEKAETARHIPAGAAVEVIALNGLTLTVRAADTPPPTETP